jgi:hypothetical protein
LREKTVEWLVRKNGPASLFLVVALLMGSVSPVSVFGQRICAVTESYTTPLKAGAPAGGVARDIQVPGCKKKLMENGMT